MADRVGSQQMNLTAVRRHDPYVADIVDSATQVAVYEYNSDTSQWQKTDMQGALFVYKRSGPPYHSFMVLNRLNTSNLLQPLTKDLEFQLQAPFLLYRTASGIIYGLWFFYENECCRLAALLESLCRSASAGGGGAAKGASIDLLTLFRHASGPKSQPQQQQQQPAAAAAAVAGAAAAPAGPTGPNSRPETPRTADEQQGQITIADLFAKASKTGQVLIGKQTVRSISVSEVEDAMPDLGGRPWVSTQPPATPQPVVVVTSQSVTAVVTSQPAAAVSPGAAPGAKAAAGTTRHAGDVDRIQQLFKSDLKLTASEAVAPPASAAPAAPATPAAPPAQPAQPAQPARPAQPAPAVQSAAAARLLDSAPAVSLMSPMMLSSLVTPSAVAAAGSISADSDAGKGGATVRSPVPGRPALAQQDAGEAVGVTPLTRRQLVQAFNYLLKNDNAFIDQLHSAYVKSLAGSFKRT